MNKRRGLRWVAGALLLAILFLVAVISDGLDGYIARKFKQITSLGRLLDPLADKILLITSLFMLVLAKDIPVWVFIVIVARDVSIIIG